MEEYYYIKHNDKKRIFYNATTNKRVSLKKIKETMHDLNLDAIPERHARNVIIPSLETYKENIYISEKIWNCVNDAINGDISEMIAIINRCNKNSKDDMETIAKMLAKNKVFISIYNNCEIQ